MSHLIRARVSPMVRDAMLHNRDRAHVHVMSAYPIEAGPSPRSAMRILWHLDPRERVLTVQSDVPASAPGLLGEQTETAVVVPPEKGKSVALRLLINCQKTPPSSSIPLKLREALQQQKAALPDEDRGKPGKGLAYRSRMVIVPEDERLDWARSRLARIGIDAAPEAIRVGALTPARLGKRGHAVPAVDLAVSGTVVDADLFAEAIRSGVGKAKNYGLGLIRLTESGTPAPEPGSEPAQQQYQQSEQ